jgi:hypothetical protein
MKRGFGRGGGGRCGETGHWRANGGFFGQFIRRAEINGPLDIAIAIFQAEVWAETKSVARSPLGHDRSAGGKQPAIGADEVFDGLPAAGVELGNKSRFFHVLGGLCHVYLSLIAFPKNNDVTERRA